MESALYYTFSTIAQALAAALGLLAAFAMFRLKGIDDECRGAAETIDSMTGGGLDLRQHYLVAEWSKLLDEIGRRVTQQGRNVPAINAAIERIQRLMRKGATIRSALWLSLILTALVMGGSVAILAFVPLIAARGIAPLVLGIGVVAFGACLWAYGYLVRALA